jgi:hypothetical protein
MLNSVVLETAIGMAFVYLLLSLIASVVQEILATFMQLRPANLQRGLRCLFSGDSLWGLDLVEAIYNHGLVRGLYADPKMDLKLPPSKAALDARTADVAAHASIDARAAANAAVSANAPDSAALQAAADSAALHAATAQKAAYAHNLLAEVSDILSVNTLRFAARWLIGIRVEKNVSGPSEQILLPAYIPSRIFALALIDILNPNKATGSEAMTAMTKSLADHHWIYKENKAGEALFSLAINAKGDLEVFQKNIENWYNDSMDRVSGWYKRYTQRILLFIGLALAIGLNVDSVRVARVLWVDKDVRQAMVNAAGGYVAQHPVAAALNEGSEGAAKGTQSSQLGGDVISKSKLPKNTDGTYQTPDSEAQRMKNAVFDFNSVASSSLLPVGWDESWRTYWIRFKVDWRGTTRGFFSSTMLPGWLITAMAISLGAPFWFDTLNKFMVVRSTIKPQEKSQIEETKD